MSTNEERGDLSPGAEDRVDRTKKSAEKPADLGPASPLVPAREAKIASRIAAVQAARREVERCREQAEESTARRDAEIKALNPRLRELRDFLNRRRPG